MFGVEEFEVIVLIDAYTGVLNWWIGHENMKILGDLEINISFTAYYKQEEYIENSEMEENEKLNA